MAQEPIVPVDRETYIDAMRDVVYMADQMIFDEEYGRTVPHASMEKLREVVEKWRAVSAAYFAPSRELRRPLGLKPPDESLEPESKEAGA